VLTGFTKRQVPVGVFAVVCGLLGIAVAANMMGENPDMMPSTTTTHLIYAVIFIVGTAGAWIAGDYATRPEGGGKSGTSAEPDEPPPLAITIVAIGLALLFFVVVGLWHMSRIL